MYSDFCFDYCVFGGSADGVFGDAVLCVSILYLCGVDDFAVGVFVVLVTDCVGGGECAGAVSVKSSVYGVGFDDGAESEIYFAARGVNFDASDYVGSGDVAVDTV